MSREHKKDPPHDSREDKKYTTTLVGKAVWGKVNPHTGIHSLRFVWTGVLSGNEDLISSKEPVEKEPLEMEPFEKTPIEKKLEENFEKEVALIDAYIRRGETKGDPLPLESELPARIVSRARNRAELELYLADTGWLNENTMPPNPNILQKVKQFFHRK
jgi:hypothetical protein